MKNIPIINKAVHMISTAVASTIFLGFALGTFGVLERCFPTAYAASGTMAPDFELLNLEGEKVSLSQYKGKIVILDFWATWCPPCRKEIPHFIELQNEYRDKGVEIVGLSLDEGGLGDVAPFAEKFGINYTMLLDGQQVAEAYGGIRGIPTTFVIAPSGEIVKRYEGYRDKAVFEEDIRALLDRKP